jgi:hypothetical protein
MSTRENARSSFVHSQRIVLYMGLQLTISLSHSSNKMAANFAKMSRAIFLRQGHCHPLALSQMMLSIIHSIFARETLFSFVPPKNPPGSSRKA